MMSWILSLVFLSQLPGAQAMRPPDQVDAVETTGDPAYEIGEKLRCPVCQGQPISESPSQMAQDMMQRVREMVAEGKTARQIDDYFVARYGEWVLLEPKAEGMNLALWILPFLALIIGAVLVVRYVRRPTKNRAAPVSKGKEAEDKYLAAIRKEVDS